MGEYNWSLLWRQSQADPYARAAMTLLVLNGVPLDRIEEARFDLESGWITTYDGSTYPLTTYALDALTALETPFSPEKLTSAAAALCPLEAEALRRMAGAIWWTTEEGRLILETVGSRETPILPLRFTFPFSIAQRLQPGEESPVALRSRQVLQTAADWLVAETLTVRPFSLQRVWGILRQGRIVFLVATTGVSGLNLLHNVLMGRLLSPADYSQLTLIITLQLLIGLLPAAVQTVTARFSARYVAQGEAALLGALLHQVGRMSLLLGGGLGLAALAMSPLLVGWFHLDGVSLLLPIIVAIPLFIAMGTSRGFLQGLGSYHWLSTAYVSEGAIRLAVGVILGYALRSAGRSLEGVVWGVGEAMLTAWFVGWLARRHFQTAAPEPPAATVVGERSLWMQLGSFTLLALLGQALITNSDFVLVKNFFSAEDAGMYAAISVLGRIVYFGALPLTVVLIPMIARKQALNEPTQPIFMILMGGGAAACGVLVGASLLLAPETLRLLYGSAYTSAAHLLAPYALAASLYTLTNLALTYQIALGKGRETWLPILAGAAQVGAILVLHHTLMQVVIIQIVLMGLLFAATLWRIRHASQPLPAAL